MPKRVILITGTPCVGKTTTAQLLASKLHATHVNLTELANKEDLILGEDKQRKTMIVNEAKMKKKIQNIIEESDKDIIIDGHYAANVVPRNLATQIFVLRRNPVELKRLMEKAGFQNRKLWENLASEILDVCLIEALNTHEKAKVCELDATGKTVESIVNEILSLISKKHVCQVGIVDWLGKLEQEDLLDEYLKT